MKLPNIYRFCIIDYETNNLFYNETKDYSEKEFQLLCAKIICEELDKISINILNFHKKCMSNKNIDKNIIKKEINVKQIYCNVVSRLEEYGFKRIEPNCTFDIYNDNILSEYTKYGEKISGNHKLVYNYYKIHLRNKKIQRIIK